MFMPVCLKLVDGWYLWSQTNGMVPYGWRRKKLKRVELQVKEQPRARAPARCFRFLKLLKILVKQLVPYLLVRR